MSVLKRCFISCRIAWRVQVGGCGFNSKPFSFLCSFEPFNIWIVTQVCHHFTVFLISKMWDRLQSYMISLIFHIYKYLLRSLTVLYVSEEMYLVHCPNLSLPISSLQDFLPQPLTSCSHYGDMPQDSLFTLQTRQQWVRQVEKKLQQQQKKKTSLADHVRVTMNFKKCLWAFEPLLQEDSWESWGRGQGAWDRFEPRPLQ